MASYQYVYVMKELSKTYAGGKKVLENLTLSFLPGAKIGVLGPNGSGKSTLMKIMAGVEPDFHGEAWAAEGVKVGYLQQEPELDPALTVLENIVAGCGEVKALLDRFNEVSMKFGEEMTDDEMDALIAEQGELQTKIDAMDGWNLERHIQVAMDALRCPPADSSVVKLSGGEKRRVALCALLMSRPDMLLLDEPTNHLDAESVAWLQHYLAGYPGTVMMITHDRYFLDAVTGWILEMDRGRAFPYEGNYSSWLTQKEKRMAQEERQEEARQRTIASELEWIRQGPKGRHTKSKARITAFDDLVAESKALTLDKAQIIIPIPPRLNQQVITLKGVNKGFGDRLLIEDLSFNIPPGAIVGVLGPNGAGKSTLFKMITGQDKPDQGSVTIGDSVVLGYVDQSRETLDPNKNVWEEITDGLDVIDLGGRTMASRAYVSAFNFKGPDHQKKVGMLSGGERNRVQLAKMLRSGANVMLLDEPTNDLDVETLRALEDALLSFPGCAIVISHDRWFLDRVATHILAFEGDAHVEFMEGNFTDYEADHKRRLGLTGDEPVKFRFKKLVG